MSWKAALFELMESKVWRSLTCRAEACTQASCQTLL